MPQRTKPHSRNCMKCGEKFETKTEAWNCSPCRTKSANETRPVINRKR